MFEFRLGRVAQLLSTSARTDLIGPEMWTGPTGRFQPPGNCPEQSPCAGIPAQLPSMAWDPPALGLHGVWCYGHETTLRDVLQIRITRASDGRSLEFRPTRNLWTPAGDVSYFRSAPTGLPGEYPFSGELALKQTRCITPGNVVVLELRLTQDGRNAEAYRLEALTPAFQHQSDGSLRVACQTIDGGLGKRLEVRAHAAVVSDLAQEQLSLRPYETRTVRIAMALDVNSAEPAQAAAGSAVADRQVFQENQARFERWFEQEVPELHTADLDLLRLYYYRWWVFYRGYHDPARVIPGHPYQRPAFYESPLGSWFGCTIGLSVGMQLQEATWLRNPEPGRNHALNWAGPTHPQYRNYIQYTPQAIWALYRQQGRQQGRALLEETYVACRTYTLQTLSGPLVGGLPIQQGSWLTGAEYQPNFYEFTTPPWDWRQDLEGEKTYQLGIAPSVRLDTACHAIANLQACARMARELGRDEEAQILETRGRTMLESLKARHWDAELKLFLAADPATGRLARRSACYDSFAPYLWGLVQELQYLAGIEKLFDPQWFWDEFPATTAAKNCPMFWSGNAIAGPTESSVAQPHPYDCSWNGPVWHFSNTLLAEALGSAAAAPAGGHLREGWLEFMRRWGEMHYLYGDRSTPCSLEHVRMTDGARFRSIIDYFHSAWIDPFLRYWAGIRVEDSLQAVVFDPFTPEAFELGGVMVHGRLLTFRQACTADGRNLRQICDATGAVLAQADGPLRLRIV